MPANPDGSQATGTACNKIPTGTNGLVNPIGQAMINLYPAPNANASCTNCSSTLRASPPAAWTKPSSTFVWTTTFPTRIMSLAASATIRHSLLCPAAHSGFCRSKRLRQQPTHYQPRAQRRHRRNHIFSHHHRQPGHLWLQPHLRLHHLARHGDVRVRHHCGGGIPNANLGCPRAAHCPPAPTAAAWFRREFQGPVIGPLAIAATLRSRVEPISSLSATRSITSAVSTTSASGIDYRANQMNVGTEAFQDGFWIVGVAGNFTGNSALTWRAIPRPISCSGSRAWPFTTRPIEGPVTGRRWKIYRPSSEDNWRVTPSIVTLTSAWRGT